ncbi:MAG: hypothetical protein HKL96_06050 [Phycisphaerales bacterium]|nr:hypothetical protein [Phycisphaerales bacterium]
MSDNVMVSPDSTATDGHAAELRRKYVVAKGAVADLAGEVGKVASDRLGGIKSHASDWAHDKTEAIKEQAARSHVAVVTYVRHNPYKSLAMALAAGLLVGYAIKRRNS